MSAVPLSERNVYVEIRGLPRFSALRTSVQRLDRTSSVFDRYGADWVVILLGLALFPAGCLLLGYGTLFAFLAGTFLLGCHHSIMTVKAAHLAAHGALCSNSTVSAILELVFEEFMGAFSAKFAREAHIKIHHPHTNIIGLGDSSTWRVPSLPRSVYLFVAPLFLPVITPLAAVVELWGRWFDLVRAVIVIASGLVCHVLALAYLSGLAYLPALCCVALYRAVFAIPYIHVNIFQHIGLPMYSQENRPKRIYQMSTGVLNLSRNPLLDVIFGHSLINCHLEHHLFPNFGDRMCLKIKPLVSRFMRKNNLPYQEEDYWRRLEEFFAKYDQLMVKAPPITHFIGIQ